MDNTSQQPANDVTNHGTGTPPLTSDQARREFILKTIKHMGGAFIAMAVLDVFVIPKLGINGMPVHAASQTGPGPVRN